MAEAKKTASGKPMAHTEIIKRIDARTKHRKKLIADDEKKRRGLKVWILKKRRPQLWEQMEQCIADFKAGIERDRQRKIILLAEREEFGREEMENGIKELIEQFPHKDPEEIRQNFTRDYSKRWKELTQKELGF